MFVGLNPGLKARSKRTEFRLRSSGVFSEWMDVISSVVQGSVLGPILFVLYINVIDTCLNQKEGITPKFADDTKIAMVVTDSRGESTTPRMENTCNNMSRTSFVNGGATLLTF